MLLGLKLLFGSTQRPHLYFKLDREEAAKPQVVGQYENAVNTVQNAGAAKKVSRRF